MAARSSALPPWVSAAEGGARLEILVQPRASRTRVAGLHGDRLKIQVAAPPVEGAANDAVVRLVARLAGVPRRSVEILRGETGRRKTLLVGGADPAALAAALSGTSPGRS